MLALLCLSQTTLQAQNIHGKTYIGSECASGGMDYYFFEDDFFVGRCSGCESTPYVVYGRWEQDGNEITLDISTVFEGQPEGEPIPPCGAVCQYESYKAVKYEDRTIETLTYSSNTGDCSRWASERPTWLIGEDSWHAALRRETAERDYPELSTRRWSKSELQGKSKSELRIMRNEIFAAYGYQFKSKDLREHFRKRGIYGHMSDVNAFLSAIELDNIDLIREVERSK